MSPRNVALRGIVHAVGLRIVASREFSGMKGSLGIWLWVDAVIKEVEAMKKRGTWDYDSPLDIETVRRRISELADERIQSPPLWEHLKLKYNDFDPRTNTIRLQSTYRPRTD